MTSYIIETVRTKCIIGEALKVRGQKKNKLSCKIVQKAPKWSLQYANFQKFSGGACPRTPLESFLALKLLKNNSAGKKIFLNKVTKIDVPPQKNSKCAPGMNYFQKAYLRPFPRLNVFAFS